MRRYVLLAFSAVLLAGCVTTPKAGKQLAQGDVVQGFVDIGRVQIPLPDGDWTVSGANISRNNSGMNIDEIFLVNLKDNVLYGAVSAESNIDVASYGWVRYTPCDRKDVYYTKTIANYDGSDQDCYQVNHLIPYFSNRDLRDPRIVQTRDFVEARKISVPAHVVSVAYRFADKMKFLTVRYFFNPEATGIPASDGDWATSEWHRDRIHMAPQRKAYIEEKITWADAWHSSVMDGFKAALGPAGPAAK